MPMEVGVVLKFSRLRIVADGFHALSAESLVHVIRK